MSTMTQRNAVSTIRFDARLFAIEKSTILQLPERASKELPSRGQVAVHRKINGHEFQTVLEPDGDRGHWMKIDEELQQAAGIGSGDSATLDIEVTNEWPEPNMPQDRAKRRPCCFDLAACTDPQLARNGRLIKRMQSNSSA